MATQEFSDSSLLDRLMSDRAVAVDSARIPSQSTGYGSRIRWVHGWAAGHGERVSMQPSRRQQVSARRCTVEKGRSGGALHGKPRVAMVTLREAYF